MNTRITTIAAIACGVVAFGMSQSARANLVANGDFESTSPAGGTGQIGFNITATGWSAPAPNSSYDFIFAGATADTLGATGEYGNVTLYPTASTSPTGGNFLGVDPSYQNGGAISQTIGGLTPGDSYQLTFWYAGAQQNTKTGDTTEGWDVTLGGTTQDTAVLSTPSGSFTGWVPETFTYTATSTSELLSFLAVGGPSGTEPPFALLDGVSLDLVPDSTSTAGLLGLGVVAMGVAAVSRRFVRA